MEKMKNLFTQICRIILLSSICLVFVQNAQAQVKVSGGVDFVSKYIWRGFNLADKPTIQPTVDFEFSNSGFALNVWSSLALASRDTYGPADELDFTVSYSAEIAGKYNVSAGFIYYTFPNQDKFKMSDHTTQEIYASFSPASLPLSPELTLFYDFNLGDDLYAVLSTGYNLPLNGHSLDFGAAVGYNNGQFNTDAGISHLNFSVSSGFQIGSFSVVPGVSYVLVPEATVNNDNEFYISLSISP